MGGNGQVHLIMGIILQYIRSSDHQVVYLKRAQCYMSIISQAERHRHTQVQEELLDAIRGFVFLYYQCPPPPMTRRNQVCLVHTVGA